ncbi:hypothetical protein Ade02nite_69470 [Paractinoplanes deccanensis]|uniref:N-acetyltransferase domain-containing protein n=1 Tax=Paractinoplanes deccanensis TaxID=113561 RepID=A0ABQ3YE70_9ACTN|nr:GNAT family N-acetyltransferase [Actinoplanes deccanensis]GID78306.1 hypothetical protein Ade02nite_69470 [Actinoplanes deccanensis]
MQTHGERALAYRPGDGDLLMLAGPPAAAGPPPAGVEVVVLGEDAPAALLRENLEVNERGFDPAAPEVSEAQAEAFRPQMRGARTVTVRVGGTAVAGGMMLPIRDGVTELAGIATLAAHRRRGYGRIATEALARVAGELGAEVVVVSTDNPAARRLYLAMGFTPVRVS